jgi:hypothetical protein
MKDTDGFTTKSIVADTHKRTTPRFQIKGIRTAITTAVIAGNVIVLVTQTINR